MKKWMFIMILLVIVIFGSVIGFNIYKQRAIAYYFAHFPVQKFPVTAMIVEPTTWNPEIDAIGFIDPNQGVDLAAEKAGKVIALKFNSGEEVKKGQILLKQYQSVEVANLEQAQAQMIFSKVNFERMKKLVKTGAISKEQYDKSSSDYLALVSQIKSLEATIDQLNINAPFTGVVGIRNVYLGQYLNPGDAITHLEDLSLMRIRFTVPQTDFEKIYVGQDVSIDVDPFPNNKFFGKITAIDSAVNLQSGVIQAQASIPNSDKKLRSGMFAKISIALPSEKNQVVIPLTAINFALYGQSVYIINNTQDKDGKTVQTVKQVVVNVDSRKGNTAKISNGIKVGDKIVTSGQVRLSNGSQIKIVKSDTLKTPDKLPKL